MFADWRLLNRKCSFSILFKLFFDYYFRKERCLHFFLRIFMKNGSWQFNLFKAEEEDKFQCFRIFKFLDENINHVWTDVTLLFSSRVTENVYSMPKVFHVCKSDWHWVIYSRHGSEYVVSFRQTIWNDRSHRAGVLTHLFEYDKKKQPMFVRWVIKVVLIDKGKFEIVLLSNLVCCQF